MLGRAFEARIKCFCSPFLATIVFIFIVAVLLYFMTFCLKIDHGLTELAIAASHVVVCSWKFVRKKYYYKCLYAFLCQKFLYVCIFVMFYKNNRKRTIYGKWQFKRFVQIKFIFFLFLSRVLFKSSINAMIIKKQIWLLGLIFYTYARPIQILDWLGYYYFQG